MADLEFTTNPTDVGSQRILDADFLHASERADADAPSDEDVGTWCLTLLEDALEKERARLMRANSMLGCVQIDAWAERILDAPNLESIFESN
jgi:hypothetical protein